MLPQSGHPYRSLWRGSTYHYRDQDYLDRVGSHAPNPDVHTKQRNSIETMDALCLSFRSSPIFLFASAFVHLPSLEAAKVRQQTCLWHSEPWSATKLRERCF